MMGRRLTLGERSLILVALQEASIARNRQLRTVENPAVHEHMAKIARDMQALTDAIECGDVAIAEVC